MLVAQDEQWDRVGQFDLFQKVLDFDRVITVFFVPDDSLNFFELVHFDCSFDVLEMDILISGVLQNPPEEIK